MFVSVNIQKSQVRWCFLRHCNLFIITDKKPTIHPDMCDIISTTFITFQMACGSNHLINTLSIQQELPLSYQSPPPIFILQHSYRSYRHYCSICGIQIQTGPNPFSVTRDMRSLFFFMQLNKFRCCV